MGDGLPYDARRSAALPGLPAASAVEVADHVEPQRIGDAGIGQQPWQQQVGIGVVKFDGCKQLVCDATWVVTIQRFSPSNAGRLAPRAQSDARMGFLPAG